jgi:hypothetical protein
MQVAAEPPGRNERLLFGAIALLCGLLHVWAGGATPLKILPDSDVYLGIAAKPIFSTDFLAAGRPPFVPLVFKLLGRNLAAIRWFQIALSVFAWSFLAWSILRFRLGGRWAWGGAIGFLMLSLVGFVAQWEAAVLAESISLSLFVLVVGLGHHVVERPATGRVVAFIAVLSAWVLSRDANAYEALMLGAVLCPLVIVADRRRRASLLVIVGVTFVLFAGASWSVNAGKRWVFPALNVLGQRILVSPEAARYFVDRGMPSPPALAERAGKFASADDWAFYKDPRLESFRQWWFGHGKGTFTKYLLTHPSYLATGPARDHQVLTSPDVSYYAPDAYRFVLVSSSSRLLPPWAVAAAWILVVAGLGVVLIRRQSRRAVYWPGLICLILTVPLAILVWHGDAMELERHSVQTAAQLRVGLCLGALAIADALGRRKAGRLKWAGPDVK